MDKKTLEKMIELFKGKGGDPESESVLIDNNSDKKEGFVSVWTNKSDAAKILERCPGAIRSCELLGGGVQLSIDRKAFRGITCAFRKVKQS